MAEKSAEFDKQRCYQMCDDSSLYMYFKNSVFSGFSRLVEPEIRIFFHHNMTTPWEITAALESVFRYIGFDTSH